MTLALPTIPSTVPVRFSVPADDVWVKELLLRLNDGNMVLPVDFSDRPQSYADVLKNCLRRHWYEITRGEQIFRWNLSVSMEDRHFQMGVDNAVWLTIGAPAHDGEWMAPTYYLCDGLPRLEEIMPGLGQTVLAVVYDALRVLPNVLTPYQSLWQAEYIYWGGYASEEDYLRDMMAEGEDPPENPFKRTDFFDGMPEWAALPKRVLTASDVRRAARLHPFADAVVRAVDRLMDVAQRCREFADVSVMDSQCDSVCWIAWLRWSPADCAPRVLDDWAQHACQGEYIEAATAVCCADTYSDPVDWLQKMHANARVARALEPVIELITSPAEQRIQVRV